MIICSLFHSMENIPSTSSSSGTSRPSVHRSYDVFINHRGMDVKNTLASHIYNALESRGICVFLDKDRMETGELITDQIEDAIRNASVQIAIFSKNYAGSPWCLNELCLMMRHPAKLLPVFYDVEPCDLRWMDKDGPYAKALKAHQEKGRYDSQILEKWKTTLFTAAGRSGCELNKGFNGDEGALVKHIVNNVLKRVKREPLDVAKYPVGLDEFAAEFEKTMLLRADGNDDENVKVVGIVGMGGAGKTTLAKHLFNMKRSDYGRSSFLFDVRSNNSLTDLQSKLLKDLTGVDEKIYNTSEGIGVLRSRLSYCQALVILDDIDHVDQLEALLVVKDVLRSGSLILVTSRDKGLLGDCQSLSLYEMRRLSKRHAQELFCWHAFLRPLPMEGFEGFVERFLTACDGLPLSLKVFGALVYRKRSTYWESQLEKMSRKLESDIKRRLRVSYDALDGDDQEMFLDVACFFIGEDKGKVIRMWDGCGWNGLVGLQTLENKCLIEFDDQGRIRMHDQLRDMGRDIVDEESNKPPRLWRPDDVIDLQRRSGTLRAIRGIRSTATPSYRSYEFTRCTRTRLERWMQVLGICVEYWCGLRFETSGSLAGVSGLKLLAVERDCFKGIFSSASTDLVWLRWYNCPYKRLPLRLHPMEKLRVLEVFGGDIQTLWDGSKGIPTQLRELDIRRCPVKFPKAIGQLKFLEKIVLVAGNIKTLPDEFCRLQSLKHLKLTYLGDLELLPQNFGDLTNLQHLDLSGCTKLQALPDSFSRLLQLQYLCLSCCRTLRCRQDTLRNILALEHVDFNYCENLEVLPIQITRQASLENLYLTGTSLNELPNEIGDLRNLKILEFSSPWLSSLPTSIWNLSSLTSLELRDCTNLKRLPQDDADDPTSSRVRYLRGGGGFEHMRNLERLVVQGCPLVELIPFTSVVRNLEKEETVLDLRHSAGLLPKLKELHLIKTEISSISIAENLCPSLTNLYLIGNIHLVEIGVFPKALESLMVRECRVLKRVTGLSHLVKLSFVNIFECWELEELGNLTGLSSLKTLIVHGCSELKELPNVAELTSLEKLNADGCWKLESIKGLEKLKRLKEVYISAGKDNGAIWNDIQFLQRLPRSNSKLLNTSLTTRAVPGVESRVQTILNSFTSPVSILEFFTAGGTFGRPHGAFKLSDIKSVSALMVCIVFKASARDEFLQIWYPKERGSSSRLDSKVFGEEGEWISMTLSAKDSTFVQDLKADNAQEISVEWETSLQPPRGMEVRKGWMVMAREGEEEGKILQVWNTLLAQLHSDCSSYHGTT